MFAISPVPLKHSGVPLPWLKAVLSKKIIIYRQSFDGLAICSETFFDTKAKLPIILKSQNGKIILNKHFILLLVS